MKIKDIIWLIYQKLKSKDIKISGFHSTSIFRKYQNMYLKKVINDYPEVIDILNIGATLNSTDKEGNLYKNYFLNKNYYTLDKNYLDNSKNHIKADIHNLDNVSKKFDLILCMSVLEHVENPFIAAKQMTSILKKNGLLYLCVPFFYPEHKYITDGYSDYWRFTDDAIKILFENMRIIWIKKIPSVIKRVNDRPIYWGDKSLSYSGICALLIK